MARVLVMDASYEDCRKAIRRAFQVFPLNLKGKSVAIKVNALRAAEPKKAICTDYRVLAAVLEEIREAGVAKITVGDNPGTEF